MRYQLIFCAILTFSLFFCSCKSQKESVYVINEEDSESLVLEHIIDNIEQSSENLILIKKAKEWLGTPYRFAHSEKGKGTDCSGMVMELFKDVFDIKLPRNSEKQAEFCHQISFQEVSPGDLVFFATGNNRKKISHVGLMIDKKQFIHASSTKGVIISDISTKYYKERFIMFGRVSIR